jgi:hypothetical protein
MNGPATRTGPERFDLLAELGPGVTVLEASAGTGKTYTIAALATRFVAEGVPLEEMLLVTFTRMATGELRERVRERLTASERHLNAALAGTAAMSSTGCWPVAAPRRWRCGAGDWSGRWRTSTRRRSRPPTASAARY